MKKNRSFTHGFSKKLNNILLYNYRQQKKLNSILQKNKQMNNYSIQKNELALMSLNNNIKLIKYRKYTVYLIGKDNPGTANLFKITKKYFYEKKLVFVLFNSKNGVILNRKNYKLQETSPPN